MKYKVHVLNIKGVAKNPFLPIFEVEFHNPVVKHILKSIQYKETLTFRKSVLVYLSNLLTVL